LEFNVVFRESFSIVAIERQPGWLTPAEALSNENSFKRSNMTMQMQTRTQIMDLPEIAVELSEREMRVISGGLTNLLACSQVAPSKLTLGLQATSTICAPADHDTDPF